MASSLREVGPNASNAPAIEIRTVEFPSTKRRAKLRFEWASAAYSIRIRRIEQGRYTVPLT